MTTAAIVLAAGKAERFGAPKQLLEIDGETLVDRACRVARQAGCSPVLRVLGARAEVILTKPVPEGVHTLVHPAWADGMGGSLAAGVARVLEIAPLTGNMLVLLADQPLVTPGLLGNMFYALRSSGKGTVVLCGAGDILGPPALFARCHFPALAALRGDKGARSVAAAHQPLVVPFPGATCDIDTPEAWQRFLARGDG